jgi:SAM-dependent methyltransferase
VDALGFVLAQLPKPPSRVLEVGCGAGELATRLVEAGYEVLAIDPEAPSGLIFRRSAIEDLDEPGPFNAVVASRSLHHVDDLAVALDKIAALLAVGGVLLIDDFGWERLDAEAAEETGIPFAEWRVEHEHLHTAQAMIEELETRFRRHAFSWEPFLYREAHHALTEEAERALIAAGRLPELGFLYAGSR